MWDINRITGSAITINKVAKVFYQQGCTIWPNDQMSNDSTHLLIFEDAHLWLNGFINGVEKFSLLNTSKNTSFRMVLFLQSGAD